MASRYPIFLILAVCILTSITRPVFAEKPLRLFFEKEIQTVNPPDHQEYVVKKGDWLMRILRAQGHSDTEIRNILPVVRKMNPDIADLNKLRPGQILQLPNRAPSSATTGQKGQGRQGEAGSAPFEEKVRSSVKTVQSKPSTVDQVMIDNAAREKKRKPVTGLPFVRTVMEQMGFRFTPGQELLHPLPRRGWLRINLEDSPLLDTPWGGRVILATTPKNEEWIADAGDLGMRVCSVSPNWSLPEVLDKVAAAYPRKFRRWGRDRDLVIHQNGLSITLRGQQLVILEQSSGKSVFMLWPRETAAEPSLPQGLPEVLDRARIKIIELDVYNQLSRLPACPRGSIYVPMATHADVLLAMGTKNPAGKNFKNLAELLQTLKREDRLHQGMARAAWYSGQKSLAVQVPAWLIAPDNKVILLDKRFNDEFLISILTQAGYSCFILPG